RDHSLVGKSLEQLDVLVAERPRLATAHGDGTDRLSLAHQRRVDPGTESLLESRLDYVRKRPGREREVRNVNQPALERACAGNALGVDCNGLRGHTDVRLQLQPAFARNSHGHGTVLEQRPAAP